MIDHYIKPYFPPTTKQPTIPAPSPLTKESGRYRKMPGKKARKRK